MQRVLFAVLAFTVSLSGLRNIDLREVISHIETY